MVPKMGRQGPLMRVFVMLVPGSCRQVVVAAAVSSLISTSGAKPPSLGTDLFARKGERVQIMDLAVAMALVLVVTPSWPQNMNWTELAPG